MTVASSHGGRKIAPIVAILLILILGGAGLRLASAQTGTPQATPVAISGVPCTALFGIDDPANACVLLINAAPDAGPVDVYFDGALAAPAVEYGILGDFFAVAPGERQVQVTVAGGDPAEPLIDTTISLQSGVAYELAAVGLVPELELLGQSVNTEVMPDPTSRLRVIHASPDAPEIELAVAGGDVLASGLTYLATSDELSLTTGTVSLVVREAGGEEIVSLGEMTFDPWVVYSYYIIGQVGDNTIGGFVVPVALPPPAPPAAATPVA
jgi:hypothetical protein